MSVANPLELNPLEFDVEEWPAELPDHLSASSLTQFQRCAEQWRRRHILGEKERPGAALVWGKADHFAHEQNFRQKIDSHEDIAASDVAFAFAEGFDREVEVFGDQIEWGDEKPGELKDKGVALASFYHKSVSPSVQPIAVEEKFTVELPGVPVPIIGFIDVEQEVSAIERKTAKRAEKTIKPDWRIQGLLYQAVKSKPVDWHVSTKTKQPAVYTPPLDPMPLFGDMTGEIGLRLPLNERTVDATKVLVQNTAKAMLAYYKMFGPHEPWPGAITHPWACAWCAWGPDGNKPCYWWSQ